MTRDIVLRLGLQDPLLAFWLPGLARIEIDDAIAGLAIRCHTHEVGAA